MNFKKYINENDKFSGLKSFITSSEIDQTFDPARSVFSYDRQYHSFGKMVVSPKEVYNVLGTPNSILEANYYDPVKQRAVIGTMIEWGIKFKDKLKLSINFTVENKTFIDSKFLDSYGSIKNMEVSKDIIFNAVKNIERLEEFTIDTWADVYDLALEDAERRLKQLFPSAKIEID